jgi:ATP-dependent Clp protease ATP-binding subunit ClpC
MIRVSSTQPPWLSERAREVFHLANQEAHRLGHCAVGAEHLLLGLVKEGISPASWVLRFVGFSLPWLRGQVEQRRPRADDKGLVPGALPYSPDLAAYVERIETAAAGKGAVLTPTHLLAGLVRCPDSLAGRMLKRRRIRWWLLRWLLRRVPGPVGVSR